MKGYPGNRSKNVEMFGYETELVRDHRFPFILMEHQSRGAEVRSGMLGVYSGSDGSSGRFGA